MYRLDSGKGRTSHIGWQEVRRGGGGAEGSKTHHRWSEFSRRATLCIPSHPATRSKFEI